MKNSMIVIFCFIPLMGCQKETETYKEKIDRYESAVAVKQLDQAILEAEKVENTKDVDLVSFYNYPIPIRYKKTHAEMGVDVAKINYASND